MSKVTLLLGLIMIFILASCLPESLRTENPCKWVTAGIISKVDIIVGSWNSADYVKLILEDKSEYLETYYGVNPHTGQTLEINDCGSQWRVK
jgi:hypothetical protein